MSTDQPAPSRTSEFNPRWVEWRDVEIEDTSHEEACPTKCDRLGTSWWILALLRSSSGPKLSTQVASDTSISATAESSTELNLWPIKTLRRQFVTAADPPQSWRQDACGGCTTFFALDPTK